MNWLHAHPITPIRKALLWYLSFDRSLYELQLHDPSSPDSASVKNISLSKLGFLSPPSYKKVSSTLLKHNWFLICLVKPRLFFWKRKYIFLLSPFTNKVITLPKIDYPWPFKYLTLTSSAQPDSPDCVFFFVDTCDADDKVTILTYRNGDKEWSAKEFNKVTDFVHCSCKIVYLRGILYIVSPYGQLASYDFVGGEFKFECLFVDELFRLNMNSNIYMYRVVELNGDLMMICFVPFENINVMLPEKPYIRRYNWSNKDWIPVSRLGDKSLFISEQNSQVATISKDDMRNSGVLLSNKIYQFFDDGCLIYSLEDGELVLFKSISFKVGGKRWQ
ncbi:uncharacterized protein LOC141663909 [Apium graveolens]|uniref:uncharacterized protein LOC141663909 n=1 Tax=Apium graveolens TaxID=4045 RepID=UPI003D7AEB2C